APGAIIAGLIRHSRIFFRRAKWELSLLIVLLLLAMVPTTGLFRWSFRWLPFFHLVLAICATEAFQMLLRERPRRWPAFFSPVSATTLLLITIAAIAMVILGTAGPFGLTASWIFLYVAVIWIIIEFFLRDQKWLAAFPAVVTFAGFLLTYLCIPPNCG